MAIVPTNFLCFTKRLARSASLGRAGVGWAAAILGLLFGVVAYQIIADVLTKSQKTEVTVHRIEVVTAPPGVNHRALLIEEEVPPTENCTQLSQQLLYRDTNGQRFYYPIGSALNGRGFRGSRWKFTLMLALPAELQSGNYMYIQRSSYTCQWLGGFISRSLSNQTPEQPVYIGE